MYNNRTQIVDLIKSIGQSIISQADNIAPKEDKWTHICITADIYPNEPPDISYTAHIITNEIIDYYKNYNNQIKNRKEM